MSTPSDDQDWGASPQFRSLRRMVALLTATLSIGVLTIAATLVIRILMEDGPPPVTAIGAEEVAIPAGEALLAVGATPSSLSVATRDGDGRERLRIFHPETGALVKAVPIRRE